MKTILVAVAASAALLLTPSAYAAPKWCDAQKYITACAVGHGDAAIPSPPKGKPCDHHHHPVDTDDGGSES